jgi:hypothetical protein
MPGLPLQLCPSVHAPQNPLPSHTRLEPQEVPAVTFPAPSTQVAAPVMHEVMPVLHWDGLLVHAVPAVHATQVPEPLQTMLLPQPVPASLLVSSRHVCTPVPHELMPFTHAARGLVVQVCPGVHNVHCPFALQTWLVPQPVPAAFMVPSTHIWVPEAHELVPL